MTVMQKLMKEEAELRKQLEAANRQGEEQMARMKNCDPKLVRMLNGNFEGKGYEDLKNFHDKLVEIQCMINDRIN